MIKLTYTYECDCCASQIDKRTHECYGYTDVKFPEPIKIYTFTFFGTNWQLCKSCAQPVADVKTKLIKKTLKNRTNDLQH